MLIINTNLKPSIMFVDKGVTYVDSFVIIERANSQIIVWYKGWYFRFLVYANYVYRLYALYKPAYYVMIERYGTIVTGNSVRFCDYSKYHKVPSSSVEFNINFICGGLRRDVFVCSNNSVYDICCKPMIEWFNQ